MFFRIPEDGQSPKKSVIPNSRGDSNRTNSAIQTYLKLPFMTTATGPNTYVVLSAHL
jgi:hypothetical protein